jgi:TonB family protein
MPARQTSGLAACGCGLIALVTAGLAGAALSRADSAPAQAAAEATPVNGQAFLRKWVPAVYPADALKARVGGAVTLRLAIDPEGKVVSSRVLDATDPRFAAAAQTAAQQWLFSPALDDGKPVAASMDAPVYFAPDNPTFKGPGPLGPPRDQTPFVSPTTEAVLSSTPEIEYPDALIDRGLAGRAQFTCVALPDGRTAEPRIRAATHVDFVAPALKAVEQLTYTPRKVGDLPVKAEVEGELTFDLPPGHSADPLSANGITGPEGGAPSAEFRPFLVVDPVFPYDLLASGKDGSAAVTYTIDTSGSPRDVRVSEASDPEFGQALLAAVELSTFTEPMKGSDAAEVAVRQRATFKAKPGGTEAEADPQLRLLSALRENKLRGAQGLDGPLTPLYRVAPRYPLSLRTSGRPRGQAQVEAVIDRDGRVRLPRIVSASDPAFGWAAATALSQWVFKAPLRAGAPTDVKVRIPIEFKPPAE